jgi:uncharacterized protein (DUF302 family)
MEMARTQHGGVEMSDVQPERNEATQKRREVVPFAGQRILYHSRLDFDQVMSNLRARVGETTVANIVELSAASESVETFEKKVQQYIGDGGFMLFAEMNHGRWIETFGIKRSLVRWIFGNPLIAITMIRRDYSAALFVPVELLLAESDDRAGCSITYVLPSSLIAIGSDPKLLDAAQALDAKVEALVGSAVSKNDPTNDLRALP